MAATSKRIRRLALTALATAAFWIFVWYAWFGFQAYRYVAHLHDRRAIPVVASPSLASHIDPGLSRVAKNLSGRDVEVRCWSVPDWYRLDAERRALVDDSTRIGLRGGFSSFDRKRIDLGTFGCLDLARLLYEDDALSIADRADQAWAVGLLAHESMHIRGIGNEATAECYGMQAIPRAAALLGLEEKEGRQLADLYRSGWYPRMDTDYRSKECRDGGELDLRPEDGIWP